MCFLTLLFFGVNLERNQNGKEMYRGTRRTRRMRRSSIGWICTDRTVRCRCQSFAKSLGRSIRQWKSWRIPCMSHSSSLVITRPNVTVMAVMGALSFPIAQVDSNDLDIYLGIYDNLRRYFLDICFVSLFSFSLTIWTAAYDFDESSDARVWSA